MQKQCSVEKLNIHIKGFKSLCNKLDIKIKQIKQISNENQSFKDFQYIIEINNKIIKGYIECKSDYFNTNNMVNEIIGSVDKEIFPYFNKKMNKSIHPLYDKFLYNKIHSWITNNKNQYSKKIKKGFGFISQQQVPNNLIFSYYRHSRKEIFYWGGNRLNDFTKKSFLQKNYPLIVVPNKKNKNYWCSINILIPYNHLNDCVLYQKNIDRIGNSIKV